MKRRLSREFEKYVDRELPLSDKEFARIVMTAMRRHRSPISREIRNLVLLGPPAGLTFAVPFLLWRYTGVPDWITAILAVAGLGALALIYSSSADNWAILRVRQELRRRGYEICSGCGYWLRELPDDIENCPECGAKREPMPTGGRDLTVEGQTPSIPRTMKNRPPEAPRSGRPGF